MRYLIDRQIPKDVVILYSGPELPAEILLGAVRTVDPGCLGTSSGEVILSPAGELVCHPGTPDPHWTKPCRAGEDAEIISEALRPKR